MSTSTTLNVSWLAATDPDNASNTLHYEVWRRVSGVGSFAISVTTLANVLSVVDSGLSPSTSYDYQVRAVDPAGTPGPFSATAVGATASANTATMNISWSAATDPDDLSTNLHYELQRKQGVGGTYSTIFTSTPNVLSFLDTGLSPLTQYCYHVRSIDPGALTSAYTADSCATTSATGSQNISLTGIAILGGFGTHQVAETGSDDITLTGIASLFSFGVNTVNTPFRIALSGIASAETFGSSGSGVWDDSAITWSDPVVAWDGQVSQGLTVLNGSNPPISLTGIPTALTFGSMQVLNPAGIGLFGISTGEAFGSERVFNPIFVFLPTIGSVNAFGLMLVGDTGSAFIDLLNNGIASAEAFGTHAVSPTGSDNVTLSGLISGLAFGVATVTNPPALFISPSGIPTGEAFGISSVAASGNVFIQPSGISTAEAFGTQVVSPTGTATISPAGIFSLEALGIPIISKGGIVLSGIASQETFGNTSLVKVGTRVPMARVL